MKLIKTNKIYFFIFLKVYKFIYKKCLLKHWESSQSSVWNKRLGCNRKEIKSWRMWNNNWAHKRSKINKGNHKSQYALTFPYMIFHVHLLNTKTNEGPVLSTSPYRHGEHEGPYNASQPCDYTNPQSFFFLKKYF